MFTAESLWEGLVDSFARFAGLADAVERRPEETRR
jgi:hypothetical protein